MTWKPTHRWLDPGDETPGKNAAVAGRRPGRRGRDRGAGRPSAFVVFVVGALSSLLSCLQPGNRLQIFFMYEI